MREEWRSFKGTHWIGDVNVRDFIQNNYTQYDGDESFLAGPTQATDTLWGKLQELQKKERENGGVLECETEVVSSLTAYGPGYIDEQTKDLVVTGLLHLWCVDVEYTLVVCLVIFCKDLMESLTWLIAIHSA